jgi:hypothetical protein
MAVSLIIDVITSAEFGPLSFIDTGFYNFTCTNNVTNQGTNTYNLVDMLPPLSYIKLQLSPHNISRFYIKRCGDMLALLLDGIAVSRKPLTYCWQ